MEPPRQGFYLGPILPVLPLATWLDFNTVLTLDDRDTKTHIDKGRKAKTGVNISPDTLKDALLCARQSEDIEMRQLNWIANALEALG